MHSNSGMMENGFIPAGMQQLHPGDEEAWRRIDSADGEPVLEIYRQFQPMFAAGMHRMRHMQQYAATPQAILSLSTPVTLCAEDREQRNTLIILFALATVLLASVLSFFWYRRYLRSRQLLQDEMKRKELVALGHLAAALPTKSVTHFPRLKGWRNALPNARQQGGEAHQLAQVMAKSRPFKPRGKRVTGTG